MLSSDAGVLLLRGVERRLGIAARLAACLNDRRDPARIDHALVNRDDDSRINTLTRASEFMEDLTRSENLKRQAQSHKQAARRTSIQAELANLNDRQSDVKQKIGDKHRELLATTKPIKPR